ncbi:lysozyme [Flectobacillus rivi]|uniref:Lysozyme n=1 Tax=Flectobacillus rivi TaxID=2984209 RepID=A0ABT6YWD3_9BACT|nr:lysozyme [Flectobacillus rivi]MDI9873196.1 lysozyme [Flectobacillus rivi]
MAEIYAAYNLALTVADSLAPEISETINNVGEFIQKLKNDVSNYVGGIQDAKKMKANFKFAEKYAETLLKDPTLPDSTRQKLSHTYQTALETKDFFCNGTDCNTTSKDGKGPNIIEELITPLCEQNKAKLLALNEALEQAQQMIAEKETELIVAGSSITCGCSGLDDILTFDRDCKNVILALEKLKKSIATKAMLHKFEASITAIGQIKIGDVCIDKVYIHAQESPSFEVLLSSKKKTTMGVEFDVSNSTNKFKIDIQDTEAKDVKIDAVWKYLGNSSIDPNLPVDVTLLTLSTKGETFLKKQEAVITHVYNDAKGGRSKYCDEHEGHSTSEWFCEKSNHYYNEILGKPTIGLGHLITSQDELDLYCSQTLSIDDCMKLFREKDLPRYETPLKNAVDVKLTQYQYDALVSFVFNTGSGGLRDRGLFKKLINKGIFDEDKIRKEFEKWHQPTIVIPRRDDETELFINGKYTFRGIEIN